MRAACMANRDAIPLDLFQAQCCERYASDDFNQTEIERTIEGVYNREKAEHGIFKFHQLYSDGTTPCFDPTIYDLIPPALHGLPNYFTDYRMRDIVFLAEVVALSSVCHFISGEYDNNIIYPNLFSFIVAPAASGKSKVSRAVQLLSEIEDYLKLNYCFSDEEVRLIIAGNNSAANVISVLDQNNGLGFIFETEGDTISTALKQDWGDFSPQIRCAYHNETIRYERKLEKQRIVIINPKLAMLVSMTYGQVKRLIRSRENGMFSRILFYAFSETPTYRSPRPCSDCMVTENDFFLQKSAELLTWYRNLESRNIKFEMTEQQWDEFDTIQQLRLKYWLERYGQHNRDILLRIGTSSFKIMMTLTALRITSASKHSIKKVKCHQDDFSIAMSMGHTLFYHALHVCDSVGLKANHVNSPELLNSAITSLPHSFGTKDFLKHCAALSIPGSTAEKWLKKYSGQLFKKLKHGSYQKII